MQANTTTYQNTRQERGAWSHASLGLVLGASATTACIAALGAAQRPAFLSGSSSMLPAPAVAGQTAATSSPLQRFQFPSASGEAPAAVGAGVVVNAAFATSATAVAAVAASRLARRRQGAAVQRRRIIALAEAEEKAEADEEGEVPEVEGADEDEADDDEPKAEAKSTKWSCGECGASNFADSAECHKCGAAKPGEDELKLMEERDAAKNKVKETMDNFLRLQADLQNYRRRHEESMKNAKGLGEQDALKKLVPFIDELDEALTEPENMSEMEKKLFDSFSLLFKKYYDFFEKRNIKRQEVEVGGKFNPLLHLKVEEREAEGDQEPGQILEVVKTGWMRDNVVLTRSEVAVVALPESEEDDAPVDEDGEDEEDEDAADEEAKEDAKAQA
eukprot:TRINITY_DN3012_c0_g1_i1.p1 TRINITY_DN3012_c0_g1~~TRINITY_DN3012_c0_g1_i1.p1  ORF type:complete len:389 (+),score=166.06 TRINITY_DN3012_c0_g1_i1:132-1298(+)